MPFSSFSRASVLRPLVSLLVLVPGSLVGQSVSTTGEHAVAPWVVWPPAAERCRAMSGDARGELARVRGAIGVDATPSAMVRRVIARQIAFDNFESDRPYRPFLTFVTDQASVFDPDKGIERDSTSFVFNGFGEQPPAITVAVSTPAAVFVRHDTAWAQADGLWSATETAWQLDPWLATWAWSRSPDVRIVARCVYRDYDRIVLERSGTYGAERLYVDPKTHFPVKIDRDEPHYLWGQQHVEYVYMSWLRFDGVRMPVSTARLVDGDEQLVREVQSARFVDRDSAPRLMIPDQTVRSTVTVPLFLRPAPVDTARLGPEVFALRNRGYNEVVALSRDTVVVMDATQGDERARADSAWIGRLFPGRHPVVVVVTDLAWPHVSGVRFWVASGATIASRSTSESFLRSVVERKWTRAPDKLEHERTHARWQFRPVTDSLRVADVSLYPIDGIASEGALMAYFPNAGLLWASDYVQDTTAPTLYAAEVLAAACRTHLAPVRGAAQHVPPFAWSTIVQLVGPADGACAPKS